MTDISISVTLKYSVPDRYPSLNPEMMCFHTEKLNYSSYCRNSQRYSHFQKLDQMMKSSSELGCATQVYQATFPVCQGHRSFISELTCNLLVKELLDYLELNT